MKSKAIKTCFICISSIFFCFLFTACQKKETEELKKVKDLDFTVVEEADLPEELLKIMNEKKASPFKLSYNNDNYLYIARGYGAQKSGGFSITINEFSLTESGIYIQTSLIGPSKEEPVTQTITHPYVVVKIEYMDKRVIFGD